MQEVSHIDTLLEIALLHEELTKRGHQTFLYVDIQNLYLRPEYNYSYILA